MGHAVYQLFSAHARQQRSRSLTPLRLRLGSASRIRDGVSLYLRFRNTTGNVPPHETQSRVPRPKLARERRRGTCSAAASRKPRSSRFFSSESWTCIRNRIPSTIMLPFSAQVYPILPATPLTALSLTKARLRKIRDDTSLCWHLVQPLDFSCGEDCIASSAIQANPGAQIAQ
jgi:hypothetical protein